MPASMIPLATAISAWLIIGGMGYSSLVATETGELIAPALALTLIQGFALLFAHSDDCISDTQMALAVFGFGLTMSGVLLTSKRWNYLQGWFWSFSGIYFTIAACWTWAR